MNSELPVPGLVVQALPADLEDYAQQIAGHGTEVARAASEKFLKGNDGCIYKPLQPPPKGWKEVSFYEDMFSKAKTNGSDNEKEYAAFRDWIPAYRGVYQRKTGTNAGNYYIKLEDALSKLGKPFAMMDIKIGQRTYEPSASQKKIDEEKGKYAWRDETGFLICGMRVMNNNGDYDFYDRLYWRKVAPQEIVDSAIRVFLSRAQSAARARQIAIMYRDSLRQLETLFAHQRVYRYYSSSLLFAYDEESAIVKMIDFAHALRCGTEDEDALDDNYLFGLRKVIAYFDEYLKLAA